MKTAFWLPLTVLACSSPSIPEPMGTPATARLAAGSASSGSVQLFSEPEEYRARDISAEAGRDYFMRTGVGDPYGAGIPYPVFLALMDAYPERLGRDWAGFNERFGTFFDPTSDGQLPVGFHLTTDPNTRVSFLMMNCQICHTDRINLPDGPRVIAGMGSKRVRLHAYGKALVDIGRDPDLSANRLLRRADRIARARQLTWPADWRKALAVNTVRALVAQARSRGDHSDRIGDGLPGRVSTIDGFVMALNWQYDAKLALPPVRGWVKIPDVAVWRYRESNSFDAVAIGAPVAQVAGADFALGVRPRWYDEHRHISTSMFLFLRRFSRQLPYPGAIDRPLARRGYQLFHNACADCHGAYNSPDARERMVSYEESVVDHEVVGTDRARLEAVTPEFVAFANQVPATTGLTTVRQTGGYVPRPLIDVWARGTYGHNGQWPSLAVLAMPPEDRPTRFVVDLDAPYDLAGVGLPWRPVDATEPSAGSGRYLYDASLPGHSVQGHTFLSDHPAEERAAILEYLKTL